MLFRECFIMAITSIKANRLRSLLTMLGIIIGVGAVIAMVSLGDGMKNKTTENFENQGMNILMVTPSSKRVRGVRGRGNTMRSLKLADVAAIQKHIKGIDFAVPQLSSTYQAVYGNENVNTNVMGVMPIHLVKENLSVRNGFFITDEAMESRSRVAVIGNTVAASLFKEENPIGKQIRLNNKPFTIIGVLDKKGSSNRGEDQDDVIFIPFTTMQERVMGIDFVNMINVSVSSGYSTTEVGQDIAALLHARHKIPENQEDDFEIMDMRALMEQFTEILNQMSLFVTAVAAISLLVGGIGIMNIMMVSVTERTREIGIRKALGATYLNIMIQFLIESMVLSGIGGLIGVGLGCAIAKAAVMIMPDTLNAYITASPIIVSVLFSMAVGLFFGIYPARKAAKLDPIDALRYE